MIINIAFQEREYVNIIGRLTVMLEDFDNSVNNLSELD